MITIDKHYKFEFKNSEIFKISINHSKNYCFIDYEFIKYFLLTFCHFFLINVINFNVFVVIFLQIVPFKLKEIQQKSLISLIMKPYDQWLKNQSHFNHFSKNSLSNIKNY